jgi:hypothetical protein
MNKHGTSNILASFMLIITIVLALTSINILMINFFTNMNNINEQLAKLQYKTHEQLLLTNTQITIKKTNTNYNIIITGKLINTGSEDTTVTSITLIAIQANKINIITQIPTNTLIPVNAYRDIYINTNTQDINPNTDLYLLIITQKRTTLIYKL